MFYRERRNDACTPGPVEKRSSYRPPDVLLRNSASSVAAGDVNSLPSRTCAKTAGFNASPHTAYVYTMCIRRPARATGRTDGTFADKSKISHVFPPDRAPDRVRIRPQRSPTVSRTQKVTRASSSTSFAV